MRQKEGIYMTHFYIIRHGETVFNRKGRIQGWCDSPLTDLGVSQAKQLGKELKNVPFDVCFCSTSERAIPVFRGLHHECLEAILRKS